jgi:hypothetical protein
VKKRAESVIRERAVGRCGFRIKRFQVCGNYRGLCLCFSSYCWKQPGGMRRTENPVSELILGRMRDKKKKAGNDESIYAFVRPVDWPDLRAGANLCNAGLKIATLQRFLCVVGDRTCR